MIGAGYAGIAAAMALQDHKEVRVLEASDRIGGRAWTVRDAQGRAIDRGAHYLGVKHRALMALIDELGYSDQLVDYVEGFGPDPCSVSDMAGRRVVTAVSDTYLKIQGLDAAAPVREQAAMLRALAEMAALTQLVDAEQPALTPGAERLDTITFAEYIESKTLPPWFADLMYSGVRGVWSQSPENMSVLSVFWYMKTNGGFSEIFCDQEGSPQQYGLRCGAGTLLERWAEKLLHPPELKQRVTRIETHESGCLVTTDNGTTLACEHVIVAITPGQLRHISFDPVLPEPIMNLSKGAPGFSIKASVFYKAPWWRNGLGKEKHVFGWLNGRGKGGIDWMLDMSGKTDSDFKLVCFITPELLDPLPRDEWEDAVRQAIVDLTQNPHAGEFESIDMIDWRDVEGVQCGPNTNFRPGMLTAAAPWWGRPLHGRIHLGAAEFSDRFCGYLEGAIHNGRRAASAVLGQTATNSRSKMGRVAQRLLRRMKRAS